MKSGYLFTQLPNYSITFLVPGVLLCLLLQTGCGDNYNPRLPAYLKAEKELRSRVTSEQGLDDSISLLVKKFKIKPEKEIAGLKDKPRAWLSLIDELLDKKIKDKNKGTGKRDKK